MFKFLFKSLNGYLFSFMTMFSKMKYRNNPTGLANVMNQLLITEAQMISQVFCFSGVRPYQYYSNKCCSLSLSSSHHKNWFAARCKCLHLIKKNLQCLFAWCEFFLIRCKYSQRTEIQFLRWLQKRL